MNINNVSSNQQKKIPVFVGIYEKLYEEIMSGVYAETNKLPSEDELSKKYHTSRNTLRQALAVLIEDGIIYNMQGSGNYINPNYNKIKNGLEKLNNLILTCSTTDCSKVEINYDFQPPAKIVQEKMNIQISEIMLISNTIYYDDNKPFAYAFSEIPMSVISGTDLDLNNKEEVNDLVINQIYKMSYTSNSRLTVTRAEETISKYLKTHKGKEMIFVEEVLFNNMGKAIALFKNYLLPESFDIRLVRKTR